MAVIDRELRLPSSDPGIELSGVETRNARLTTRAKVLLVAGSGPQDRDQTVAGLPTFRILREALAEAGFAALSFDRRGVGGSGGSWFDGSGEREVEDLLAAVEHWQAAEPDVPLFLLGHSQGGAFALEAAPRVARLAGLLLLATSGRPGRETLEAQHRALCALEGWDEESIEDSLALKQACFDILETMPEQLPADQTERLRDRLRTIVDAFYRKRGVAPESVRDELDAIVDDLMEWEWRYLLRTDPSSACLRVEVPVFLATGTRDAQTDASIDPQQLAKQLARTQPTLTLIDDADHLFRIRRAGTAEDRSDREASHGPPMDRRLLRPLLDWLTTRIEEPSLPSTQDTSEAGLALADRPRADRP